MLNTEKPLTSEQSSFMADVFSAPDEKCKFLTRALLLSYVLGTALDEMLDTPLRDLQVFDPKIFGDISGLSLHSILTPITIAFTLFGALPFIAKVFNKNTISNLSDVINNIQDSDPDFEISDEELKQKFDDFLKKKGYGHLEVEIKVKEKRSALLRPFLGKLEKKSLQFKYREGDGLKKILFSDWKDNKDKSIQRIIDELIIKLGGSEKAGLPKLDSDPRAFLDACKELAKNPDHPNLLTLTAIIKLLPLIINENNILNNDITLAQLRDAFIEKVNSWSAAGTAGFAYDQTMNYSFNFWLTFFVADLIECNADTGKWKKITQAVVLISAGAISAVQLSWQALQHWYSKKPYEEVTSTSKEEKSAPLLNIDEESDEELTTHTAITQPIYKNKSLKHQLVEEFFIEQLIEKRKKEVQEPRNRIPQISQIREDFGQSAAFKRKSQIKAILHEEENYNAAIKHNHEEKVKNAPQINPPPMPIRLKQVYQPVKTKTSEQFDLLRDEVSFADDPNTTTWQKVQLFGKRYFSITQSVFKYCIGIGFIGWVVGAICVAVGGTAAAAGAVILGNPVSVACAVGGGLLGLALSYSKVGAEEKAEQELQQQFDANKEKIEKLEKLESQNYQLKNLLKENKIKPLTTLKAHDDRSSRRLTTEKPGLYTKFKEGMNRFAVAVGRGGSGILIIRLAVMPALAIGVGVALGGPVGLALALGLGLIWMAANVYHYHQASKLEAAKRTLDDIDNRIKMAEANQEIYLNQLGYSDSLTKDKGKEPESEAPSVAAPKAAEIPSVNPQISFSGHTDQIVVEENEAQVIKRLRAAYHSIKRKNTFFEEPVHKVFTKLPSETNGAHLRRIIAETKKPGTCWGYEDDDLFKAMERCGYFFEDGSSTGTSSCFSTYWNEKPKAPLEQQQEQTQALAFTSFTL